MKTQLAQQTSLVRQIQESSLPQGVRLLRDWLKDNGYEGEQDCKHYAIIRSTGKCMNCPAIVAEPMVLDSDETIATLRARLGR